MPTINIFLQGFTESVFLDIHFWKKAVKKK